MIKLIEVNTKELKELRFKQWQKQKGVCPIFKSVIPYCDVVFDHKHKTKAEKIGEDGKGLLRGVIHNLANIFEGKIVRVYKRYGLNRYIALPDLLRNIAFYLENPPMEPKYIHPKERTFELLKKSEFNLIKKYYFKIYPKRKKFPLVCDYEDGKKVKMTKTAKRLLKEISDYRNK